MPDRPTLGQILREVWRTLRGRTNPPPLRPEPPRDLEHPSDEPWADRAEKPPEY